MQLSSQLTDDLLAGLASSGASPGLDAQHVFEDDSRVALIRDDLSVLVETESLGSRVQRKLADVVEVVLL